MANDPQPDLGKRISLIIKRLRQAQGMNQVTLAEQAGVTQGFISQMENGQANLRMNINTLQAIALALGEETLSSLIAKAENVPSLDEAVADVRSLVAELDS